MKIKNRLRLMIRDEIDKEILNMLWNTIEYKLQLLDELDKKEEEK